MLFRFWVFPDCTFLDISIFISLKFPMVFLLKKVSAWQLITLDKHE